MAPVFGTPPGCATPVTAPRSCENPHWRAVAVPLDKGRVDVNALIDAIVRQTTVLIAQLATATGGRAPLVNTANRVFVDLVRELREQGLGNKVIADMFGLALRTYHDRVRRLSESTTFRGRSLWEATLAYIEERDVVRQAEVLDSFQKDDEASVRGVLADLADSGVVFRSGRGPATTYRAARPEELAVASHGDEGAAAMPSCG